MTEQTQAASQQPVQHPNIPIWQAFVEQYNKAVGSMQQLDIDVAHKALVMQQLHLGFVSAQYALHMSLSTPPAPKVDDVKIVGVQESGAGNNAPVTPVN